MPTSTSTLAVKFAKKLIKRAQVQSAEALLNDIKNQRLLLANSGLTGKINISNISLRDSMIDVGLAGLKNEDFLDPKSNNFKNIDSLQKNIENFLNVRLGKIYSVRVLPALTYDKPAPTAIGRPKTYQELTGREPGTAYVEKEKPRPLTEEVIEKKPVVLKSGPPNGYVIRPRGKENDPYADRRVSYKAWMSALPEKKRGWVVVREL